MRPSAALEMVGFVCRILDIPSEILIAYLFFKIKQATKTEKTLERIESTGEAVDFVKEL